MDGMEYEYRELRLSRETSRNAALRLLTEYAEYGHWELDRLRLYPDGTRHVKLRRRIIRQYRDDASIVIPV
ncbi:MAG: hypothetical protein QOG52_473 [Frankiaceae bacterium]|jgi:hypothetical protein|nr:hypothetical protein [Frankiaceae bacterium]MDQ1723445.1 hypothetical protein [Frankiaceae bacterium]